MNKSYEALAARLEEINRLECAMGILHWDQEVMMPEGATEARARQISAMAGVIHEKSTDPQFGELLENLSMDNQNSQSLFQKANIREARRDYDRETKVPKTLVQEMAELSSLGHLVWVKAREENKFSKFAPVIKRWIELKTEWARCINPDKQPYDMNIDIFERGGSMTQFDGIFDRLKEELIPLIRSINESDYQPDNSFMEGEFPIEKQQELGLRISQDMGFSFDTGRIDISVHPFCGGAGPTDVRITTRYRTDNFVESLYAAIHETGHGLYEQGRMKEGRDLPVSQALSMGIHESQSLFWERMIAQGKPFCFHYLDIITSTFPESLNGVSLDRFYEGINCSQPSLIRVEADEVTYPMHIILRYEMEKGLFNGSITVDDLPAIWNKKMEEYLGIRPETDTEGVLQDIHWSMGSFGYFPSYTLGAMYACQFYRSMKKEQSDIETKVERGEFSEVKDWLNKNIHSQGRLFLTDDLVKRVTGETLNPEYFINHLQEKYKSIYRF